MDEEHPTGPSQHRKIVVIDDRAAFSGGIDLTGNRWDTPNTACTIPGPPAQVDGPANPFTSPRCLWGGECGCRLVFTPLNEELGRRLGRE
ncbi:hypothetical protein TRIP_B350030 [uncultured Desulfatiglans sp.]|uniref:PLD phosphodiesterase domain-containing protein n=1 Tax=Uncultured Desulfatiglans sp. TaxID=1748965 RepID=A0A653A9V3_UNCDX|nr:hypothetical protein TRIP_B350030 [uncultured Desulfatiglans sp.]